MHRTKVRIVEDALDANNTIAAANRADFDHAELKVVNFMSAPGAGKQALEEQALPEVDETRVGDLEGDMQGSLDADRLAARAPRCRDDARKRSDRCRDRAVQGLARRG